MISVVDKTALYATFGVKNFNSLEEVVHTMAPSIVEYHLSDICFDNERDYFNKREIENSIEVDRYSLYIDYNKDVYLETKDSFFNEDFITNALL